LKKKKRTIVRVSARKGFLNAAVYLPERLLDQLNALPLAKETKDQIRETNSFCRSRPYMIEERNQKILKDPDTVMQFGIATK